MPKCEGKVRYGSKHAATRAAHKTERVAGKGTMEAYLCSQCHGFHVGHSIRTIGGKFQRAAEGREFKPVSQKENA